MTTIDTLELLAREINVRLAKASEITRRAEENIAIERRQASDHRLAAALQLKKAREIVDAGGAGSMTWAAWCRENVEASRSEIKRLLKIAGSPEPATALDAERAAAREGMRRMRAGRREGPNNDAVRARPHEETAGTSTSDPLDSIKAAICGLDAGNLERLKAWFQAYCGDSLRVVEPISAAEKAPDAPQQPKTPWVCYAPNGECRYSGCPSAGTCLAARKAA